MIHASEFTGIMGFDLAAEAMGWENRFAVEKEEYCQKLITKRMPYIDLYSEISEFNNKYAKQYESEIDILTGGFPCQPFSVAGNRNGADDDRYLWPEMLKTIKITKPAWVIGENVAGIKTMGFGTETIGMESYTNTNGETDYYTTQREKYVLHGIIEDLEREGFEVQTFELPALSVGAPHRRMRMWIVGYSKHNGLLTADKRRSNAGNIPNTSSFRQHKDIKDHGKYIYNKKWHNKAQKQSGNIFKHGAFKSCANISNTKGKRFQRMRAIRQQKSCTYESKGLFVCDGNRGKLRWPAEPGLGRVANGVPDRVDRIRGLGNAIVPQVAYELFYHIDIINKNIKY